MLRRGETHRASAGLCIAAVGAIVAAASPALAAGPGPRASLRYQRLPGAESCPTQPAFVAEVSAWLGYDPFSDASPREVIIELAPDAGGLGARLRLEDWSGKNLGERQISTGSVDCRDLTQALVLAVALAVDPLPVSREVIGSPASSPGTRAPLNAPSGTVRSPGTSPKTSGQTSPTAPSVSEERAIFTASLGAALWVAAGPEPAPGVLVGLEARWGHFSMGLEGQADYPTDKPWLQGSIQVSLLTAELLPCYHLGMFGVCGLVALGAEVGHGRDLRQATSQPLPYIGAGARLLAEIPIGGPFAIRLHLDGLATALGASFYVGSSDVWDNPPVAFEAAATLALRL